MGAQKCNFLHIFEVLSVFMETRPTEQVTSENIFMLHKVIKCRSNGRKVKGINFRRVFLRVPGAKGQGVRKFVNWVVNSGALGRKTLIYS